LTDFQKICNY